MGQPLPLYINETNDTTTRYKSVSHIPSDMIENASKADLSLYG